MPLIKKPGQIKEKKQIRIRLSEDLIEEINNYCTWADLPSLEYFIEQAALLSLRKDKDWRNNKDKSYSKKFDNESINKSEKLV